MIVVWLKINLVLIGWGLLAFWLRRLFKDSHEYVRAQKLFCLLLPLAIIGVFAVPDFRYFSRFGQPGPAVIANPAIRGMESTANLVLKSPISGVTDVQQAGQALTLQTLFGPSYPGSEINWLLVLFCLSLFLGLIQTCWHLARLRKIITSSSVFKSLHGVQISASEHNHSPFAFWLPGRLHIVMPIELIEDWRIARLVMKHEFAHHRLYHTALVYPMEMLNVLFALNPGFRIFRSFCHDLMEYQCDASLQKDFSSYDYGASLLHVAKLQLSYTPKWGLAMATSDSQLKRRIRMLNPNGSISMSLKCKLKLASLSAVLLVGSSLAAGMKPTASSQSKENQAKSKHFCGQFASAPGFSLGQFSDLTEVQQVVDFVSKRLKVDILMDRNVSGKISILQGEAKSSQETCEIFMSALDNLNLTLVDNQGVYLVHKVRNALRNPLPTYSSTEQVPATAQWIRKVFQPKHLHVEILADHLKNLMSPRQVVVNIPSNSLLISGTGHKIKEIESLLSSMDVPCDTQCQERTAKYQALVNRKDSSTPAGK